jgi:hypothetical protein
MNRIPIALPIVPDVPRESEAALAHEDSDLAIPFAANGIHRARRTRGCIQFRKDRPESLVNPAFSKQHEKTSHFDFAVV